MLHATRELLHRPVAEIVQARHGQQLVLAQGQFRRRDIAQFGEEIDVLLDREFGVEVEAQSLRHETEAALDFFGRSFGVDFFAEDVKRAALKGEHTGDGLHQAAFSGAVGADQAVNLTALNGEAGAVDRHLFAIAFDEILHPHDGRVLAYHRGLAHGASSFQRIMASAGRPGVARCCGLASR